MAGKSGGDPKKILSDILGRIGELSDAINEKNTKSSSVANNANNSSVDDEVRKVFSGSSGRSAPATCTTSTRFRFSKPNGPAYTMKRSFTNVSSRTKKARPSRPFTRDLILLLALTIATSLDKVHDLGLRKVAM